jgi:hypothetical protein
MCKLVRLLYGLVRWKTFRAFLIRRHMEDCPRCAIEPTSGPAADGLAGAIRPPDWIRAEGSLWPEIRKRMMENAAAGPAAARPLPAAPARRRLAGRLVPAAAVLAGVAILGVLAWRTAHRTPAGTATGADSPRVEVLSAEVGGRKARPSIFQTINASYIWFSQTPDEGGRK